MTLDVLHFIDNKGGNAEEIRESQRKRGLSVELVDEVIQMYADWVKSARNMHPRPLRRLTHPQWTTRQTTLASK